ncbi:hypothetical protein PABG_02823 [Paracoccidioides brasiliensis Pb03]|uniref:Uncharacterized protein n=2 Tax=Paracoccidioides brasiliensis TaxID=121759 RepID=C1G309_PARBD|nr:uncharacterized protein PADG_01325 [Paracoccidioides brasiliensis Pb18]EEH20592.2 hypothetical protein PABG_02823 [Paracoccidioides brasiliensis Pb03]EEH45175.2 hypothetical protein PADG_01325 [Paracoccidioides brasiliensis Pb18]ODH51346.1 hypothetical protein GX48_02586 [Paracoccidioides brasiliensis]
MSTKRDRPVMELLQAEACDDDQSFFHIPVGNRYVKYLSINPGPYALEDICFGPVLASILPDVPHGNQNDGLAAKHPETGHPYSERACSD